MRRAFLLLLLLLLSSCAMMPYSNDTLCSRGKEGGLCGRVSDVYRFITEEEDEKVLDRYLVP